MFENNPLNQLRQANNVINSDVEPLELPQPTSFEVEGAKCLVSFIQSQKSGKIFVVLTAEINGVPLTNKYSTKTWGQEDIDKAVEILTNSVKALKRIFKYNINADKDEDNHIIAKFDWETYGAFRDECSFGDYLPEVPQEDEGSNDNGDDSSAEDENENQNGLSCEINLKKANELTEFADLLDETWNDVIEKFSKENLYAYTVKLGKEELTYISSEKIRTDNNFVYFEGNITSEDYARQVSEVKYINRTEISRGEVEALKQVIFSA